jgi:serine dehydrogenase proteinase
MSAASMLACASDRIVMGKHSSLGPIDPQLILPVPNGMTSAHPAQAILEQFELARDQCKDPKLRGAWIPILPQYGPSLLIQCRNALDLAEELVAEWLRTWMLAPLGAQKATAQSRGDRAMALGSRRIQESRPSNSSRRGSGQGIGCGGSRSRSGPPGPCAHGLPCDYTHVWRYIRRKDRRKPPRACIRDAARSAEYPAADGPAAPPADRRVKAPSTGYHALPAGSSLARGGLGVERLRDSLDYWPQPDCSLSYCMPSEKIPRCRSEDCGCRPQDDRGCARGLRARPLLPPIRGHSLSAPGYRLGSAGCFKQVPNAVFQQVNRPLQSAELPNPHDCDGQTQLE